MSDYSAKEFDVNEELSWDIFNVGVDKSWLIAEYKNALDFKNSDPCDEVCSSCGVCQNLQTEPSLKGHKMDSCELEQGEAFVQPITDLTRKYTSQGTGQCIALSRNDDDIHRYRIKIQKTNELKYISHLDWQKLLYAAIRKAGLKINFTQGFNPSPKISLAVALPIFVEGIAECAVYWAKYKAFPVEQEKIEKIDLKSIVKNCLLQDNIVIEKISKKNCLKKVDIRPAIHSLNIYESNGRYELDFILKAGQDREPVKVISLENSLSDCKIEVSNSTLRADHFLNILIPEIEWDIVMMELIGQYLHLAQV